MRGAVGRFAALAALVGWAGPASLPAEAPGDPGTGRPSLAFVESAEGARSGAVVVSGLRPGDLARLAQRRPSAAEWEALLSVRTETAEREGDWPAVLGSFEAEGGEIRFRPRFPFRPALAYRARFDGALFDALSGGERRGRPPTASLEISFVPAEPEETPPTVVEAVYPTGPEVPANLLRLYVHFTGPVWPKGVEKHVKLLDGSGREVPLPFVEVEHGLWDAAGRRLTLFFHPGRVKRGVGPHVALGPPLVEGETYRLVIGPEIQDARGRRLGRTFEHELWAGPPDRASPEPARWRLAPPATAGGELIVDLPEPLDHSLLERLLSVHDAEGRRLPGAVTVGRAETRWSFRPEGPWLPGPYTLRVDPGLEDLAGNSIHRLFEEEAVTETPGRRSPPEPVAIPFRVGGR